VWIAVALLVAVHSTHVRLSATREGAVVEKLEAAVIAIEANARTSIKFRFILTVRLAVAWPVGARNVSTERDTIYGLEAIATATAASTTSHKAL